MRGAGSSEDDGEAVAEGVSGVQGSESARKTTTIIHYQSHILKQEGKYAIGNLGEVV